MVAYTVRYIIDSSSTKLCFSCAVEQVIKDREKIDVDVTKYYQNEYCDYCGRTL